MVSPLASKFSPYSKCVFAFVVMAVIELIGEASTLMVKAYLVPLYIA